MENLVDGLSEIFRRTTDLLLLRETDLGPGIVDNGDIDLLVAGDALPEVLEIIDDVAAEQNLHYRLQRTGSRKTGVTIFTADMAHSVRVDLWVQLWQIFGGRSYLTYRDVERFAIDEGRSPRRLPADLEASVYVQHLAVKRRDPSSAGVAERLRDLSRRCPSDTALAGALERIQSSGRVDADAVLAAEQVLTARCGPRLHRRSRTAAITRALSGARRRRLERRFLPAIALIGVDGCGKSSLARAVAENLGFGTFLTKDAYRRSWFFRGVYHANRRMLRLPYEPIDNALTPLTYAVAAHRLPKIVTETTVLDRYLGDFLVVDRKSDAPRLSHLVGLLVPLHRPCVTIHIRADWATITTRKKEVTQKGHAWYDKAMLRHYATQPVLDYLSFRNNGDLAPAADVLTSFLAHQRFQPGLTRR